ncbi:hypothetical protein K438DRAFT_1855998 [Mycena galopus ATCC 62051]|nr:hypothetical protein K438DRAFT_1855998 [Mycena galopus ATCC 62051]
MKAEQPGPQNYTPRTSSPIEFQFKWRAFRVNPQNVELDDFPFHPELQQDRYSIHFIEFRSSFDPPVDIGNPGDIWLNVSRLSYTLFALNAKKEWIRWPGPTLDKERMIPHPFLPIYALWCTIKQASWYHRDKLGRDWSGEKLVARQKLGGYSCVDSMLGPSAGVRLILLQEEKAQRLFVPPEAASSASRTTSIDDQLKSAVGGLASSRDLPQIEEALVSTLSAGIDHLLTERKRLSQALFEAEERAAMAELKLARLDTSTNHYRAHCHASTSSVPAPHSSQKYLSSNRDSARKHPPDTMDNTVPSSVSNIITSRHLDILFRPAEGGRSKNCLICLALVTYNPDQEISALMFHALGTHPVECSVFASVPDDQLEVYRQEFQ